MRFNLKIAVVIVIAILLITSAYVLYNYDEENNNNDKEAPTIDIVTGNTSGTTGKITTIDITFSDNIEVTEAILYYKPSSDENWRDKTIINGSATIQMPSDSTEDWYYYIVIDDEAGNGPIGDPSTDGSVYYTIEVSEDVMNLVHTVFVEEGTATTCVYCPNVADILHRLFDSNEYNFYYVAMVEDKNDLAYDHLHNDHNIYGNPTVYIDGGYDVILGGEVPESNYAEAIRRAENRDVPKLSINIETEYDNNSDGLLTNVIVENFDDLSYKGRLKIYLTEITSRWNNNDNVPYHYSFLDYIYNKDIEISGMDKNEISPYAYDVSDLDIDNLMVVAVIFSSEEHAGFSQPPNEYPFDAYYADATDGTRVVEGGNLPPEVGITFPTQGQIYRRGRPILKIPVYVINLLRQSSRLNSTFLIGKTTISAYAEDADSGIEKVEFYINNELMKTVDAEPYEWTWKNFSIGKKTITVKAYDTEGKVSEVSLEVRVFIRPYIL